MIGFIFSPPSASSLRIQRADLGSNGLKSNSLTQITKLPLNLPSDACTAVSDTDNRCGGFLQCRKHQAVSACLPSPASNSHCFPAHHHQGAMLWATCRARSLAPAKQGGEHSAQPLPKAATAKLHQVSIKLLLRKNQFENTAVNKTPG